MLNKYVELLNFEMEVTNILQMKAQELTGEEYFPIIMNWLGREDYQLIKIFTSVEQKTCKTAKLTIFFANSKIQAFP